MGCVGCCRGVRLDASCGSDSIIIEIYEQVAVEGDSRNMLIIQPDPRTPFNFVKGAYPTFFLANVIRMSDFGRAGIGAIPMLWPSSIRPTGKHVGVMGFHFLPARACEACVRTEKKFISTPFSG
jgi:hypothetical protein